MTHTETKKKRKHGIKTLEDAKLRLLACCQGCTHDDYHRDLYNECWEVVEKNLKR